MDLPDAARDLYGIPPGDFLERRKELVAGARAAKDRDAVKAIGALRRPTVSAWLVNLLTRDEEGAAGLATLAALGVSLRQAQAGLEADRLRELGRERRTRVADLVSRAVELAEAAGHPVGQATEREIDETLVAAVADEAAAQVLLSGLLTRALSYAGFGEVDIAEAVAVVARPKSRPRVPEPAPPPELGGEPVEEPADVDGEAAAAAAAEATAAEAAAAAEQDRRIREAQEALAAAEATVTDAERLARQATERLETARAAAAAAADSVSELQQRLAEVQTVAETSAKDARDADLAAAAATSVVEQSKASADQLRAVLAALQG